MRILFVNTNIGYGGASKMMVWLANVLDDNGHDVTFLTYRSDEILQPLSDSIKFIFLPLEPLSGHGHGLLHTIKTLRGHIKTEKYDLAIGFLSPSQLRLALACRGLKTKLLFSHRADPYRKANGLKSRLSAKFFEQADYYVFQTEKAKAFFSKRIGQASTVIANPITPLRRTASRIGKQKTIVSLGRLDIKQKRQDILIEAFNSISRDYPDYVLELYGDGEDEKRIRELAANNPSIHIMGKTADVVNAVQSASVFVLSSDFEGIPNALLEAMSLGVPCVSTDCSPGGAKMLIRSGYNGLITPRGDSDALASAIKYMLDNPETAEKMGVNATNVNETFSEERIAKQWLDIITKISEG